MRLLLNKNKNINLAQEKELKRNKVFTNLIKDAGIDKKDLFEKLKSREEGLTNDEVEKNLMNMERMK